MAKSKTWTLKEATSIFKDSFAQFIAEAKATGDQTALNSVWNDWTDGESRGMNPNVSQKARQTWCCPIKVPKRR